MQIRTKFMQIKTIKDSSMRKTWPLQLNISMQTNRMIWEILFSDIDLKIFKIKKKNVMPRYRK
jgi:hypothetical protein